MKEIQIKVPKTVKYITELPRFSKGFETNKIYIKTLPGWGATHGETKIFHHHSICVNPFLPVIEGKEVAMEGMQLKYPNMLCVYGKTTHKQITDYLSNDIQWKKILCTPEAYFSKVKPTIEKSKFNLYDDFYMLLDESDRIIKDGNFRPKIVLPMDDFFNFKNKSMISATALIPSDPRFETNGFEICRIVPDYDYSQPLNVVFTNNIIASLEKVICENPKEKFFIFINSATHIYLIIKALGIENKSTVYCSDTSVRKLSKEGFENSSSRLDGFTRFNFFTSRYFSAVDIFLDRKPIVVMLTDVFDEKTLLDPYTDNVQIVGRPRNGVNSIYHITGINPNLQTIEEKEARQNIMDSYKAYQEVETIGRKSTSSGGRKTISECLSAPTIVNLINEDGTLNYNMIDNFILENTIKIMYKSQTNLLYAYSKIGNFDVSPIFEHYGATHKQMMADYRGVAFLERCRNVAEMIHAWRNPIDTNGNRMFVLSEFIGTLEKENKDILEYINKLGYMTMKHLGWDKRKMDREIAKLTKKSKFGDPFLRQVVHSSFTLLLPVIEDTIAHKLTTIYKNHGYDEAGRASHFDKFFIASRSTKDGKHIRTPTALKYS